MNKVFRIVRRKCDGQLVVVGELAKNAVKGLGALMTLLSILMAHSARASDIQGGGTAAPNVTAGGSSQARIDSTYNSVSDTTSNSANTSATFAAPIVEVRAANPNGVSLNTYNRFNVTSTGVILNNILDGQTAGVGLQAGAPSIDGDNTTATVFRLSGHAGGGADVIINQVVGTGGTSLAGTIEVAGQKADVVIADANGITCTGCGFINADLAGLVSGTASVNGDIVSFALSDSALTINNNTQNAGMSAFDTLLLARELVINGQVSGRNIRAMSHNGTVQWDTDANSLTTNASGASDASAPLFGIDSSTLGGMYGDTITLVANESGTGVRIRKDMTALGGSIEITADGQLIMSDAAEIQGRSIELTSDNSSVELNATEIAASQSAAGDGGELTITAATSVTLVDGSLESTKSTNGNGGSIDIVANQLVDNSNSVQGSTRVAAGDLQVNLTDTAEITQSAYAGGDSVDLDATTVTLGAGSQIEANGALNIDASALSLDADATLQGFGAVAIVISGDATLNGTLAFAGASAGSSLESTDGDISLSDTAELFATDFTLLADGALAIAASSVVQGNSGGSLTLQGDAVSVLSAINSTGSVAAIASNSLTLGAADSVKNWVISGTTNLTGADVSINSNLTSIGRVTITPSTQLTLDSSAQIDARGGLTISGADDIDIAGAIVASDASSVAASGNLTLAQGATLTTRSSADLNTVVAGALTNRGQIDVAGALTLGSGSGSLINTGRLVSLGDLTVNVSGTAYNQAVISSTTAGRNLGFLNNNGTPASTATVEDQLNIDENQIGLIQSGGAMILSAAEIINEGDLQATGTITANAVLRSQMAGIWDGNEHAGSSREALTSQRAQYDFNESGTSLTGITTSYYLDEYLLTGRATYAPTINADALVLNQAGNLNIGGTINPEPSGQSLTQIDLSANRSLVSQTTEADRPSLPGNTLTDGVTAVAINDGDPLGTSVEFASNNATTVVNIAQPKASGLSNNRYTRFDINSAGLILNNTRFSEAVTVETDLSAVITSNPQLTRSASVILNQVLSTSGSSLAGFLEVAGDSADVVIVNPAGISCDGCGIINVDRLDLVVGDVSLANDQVVGFSTDASSGAFTTGGDGIDAMSADLTAVIAGTAFIGGTVNTNDLFIGLGAGNYARNSDGTTRTATGNASYAGNALSITEPAGLFADRIEVVNNAGTGTPTNMLVRGEIAANNGSVNIETDGSINLSGRISGTDQVNLLTSDNNNGEALTQADIQLANGSITAGSQMKLEAAAGSLVLNGGQLYAFDDMTLTGLKLIDEGSDNPAEFNNTRFSGGILDLAIRDKFSVTGTRWEADTFLLTSTGYGTLELNIGDGAVMKALTLMDVNADTFSNTGTVASLQQMSIDVSDWIVNSGTLSAGSDMPISAVGNINNRSSGIINVNGDNDVTASALSNAGTWVSSVAGTAGLDTLVWDLASLDNSGSGKLTLGSEWNLNVTGGIQNRGKVFSEIGTQLLADRFDNSGEFTVSSDAAAVDSTWSVATDTINSGAGQLISEGNWDLTTQSLDNSATLQGAKNLSIQAAELTLNAGEEIAGAMNGNPSDALSITLSGGGYNARGNFYSKGDLNFTNANYVFVENTASFIALDALSLTASSGDISNYGFLYSGDSMALSAAGIGNFAAVSKSPGRVIGTPFPLLGSGTLVEAQQQLIYRGDIYAGGDFTANASGNFVNSSEIRAGGQLTVSADTIANQPQRDDAWDLSHPLTTTQNQRFNLRTTRQTESFKRYPDTGESYRDQTNWDEFNYYTDGVPAVKPLILSAGNVNMTARDDLNNYGGLIQSTGSGTSSLTADGRLVNDALALQKYSFEYVQNRETLFVALGGLTYHENKLIEGTATPASVNSEDGVISVEDAGGAAIKVIGDAAVEVGVFANIGSVVAATPGSSDKSSSTGLGGITVTLPDSPNGFFVTNRDPSATYLVEMNPKLQAGVSTLGSDYLLENLNINTDSTTRRLGDASYEAYLVEQQLIAQTGAGVLDGYDSIADVMSGFMGNAVSEAASLGLTFGQPLTKEQINGLESPIVWMVETVVDGQTVLAPQVYLPKAIQDEIAGQNAVVSADDLSIDAKTVDNIGGDINAESDLQITAQGDINNLSGNIRGNNVSVTSVDGDINNETFNQYVGNDLVGETQIGRTAGIQANNDLDLDAAGDITNLGAQVSAGNDASLQAGGDITFDTIEEVTRTFEQSSGSGASAGDGQLFSSTTSLTKVNTEDVNQIGSGLTVGGDLSTDSGGDTTFAGTEVNVAGDADIQSAGEINIIARENRSFTSTETVSETIGLGKELFSTETTKDTEESIRNFGSTFNVGGDARFDAADAMTIQGSDVNVEGNASIDASELNVLAGRDLDRSTSESEKSTIGVSVEKIENVDGTESEGVTFGENVNKESLKLSQRSVASGLNIGGNLDVEVDNAVTLQGSEINAGGDVNIDAEDVVLLAAQNIELETSRTETTKIGLYASGDAEGEAGTETDAGTETGTDAGVDPTSASAGASANASANASAGASAGGNASATLDFGIGRTDTALDLNVTNTGSGISSGGNMRINARNRIELEGSTLNSDGDMDLDATDIISRAAEDISISERTSESTRVGIYVDAGGSAEAGAEAGAESEASANADLTDQSAGAEASAKASANAEAEGKVGAGIQTQVAKLSERDTSITSQVSGINAGGSLSRNATNRIVDVGTEINVGENFEQSANSIVSLAARNEQTSERSYEEVTAKVGVYAEAEGEASAEAGAEGELNQEGASGEVGAQASAEGGARVGVEVMVDTLSQTESSRDTQAITSTINVGGDFASTSENDSVFEGTSITTGGDLSVEGENINILAARDTSESSFSETTTSSRAAVAVGVGGEASAGATANSDGEAEAGAEAEGGVQVKAEIEFGFSESDETERSTEAVTAAFQSGGTMTLDAENDVNIEGADIDAETVNVLADELNFTAAQNTSESTSSSSSVDVEIEVTATIIGAAGVDGEVGVAVETENGQGSSSEAVTGSLSANNLNITTRSDANFEGTQVEATDSANLDIGGDLNVTAAANTEQESANSTSVEVNAEASSSGEFAADAAVAVGDEQSSSSEAVVSTFNVGNLNVTTGGDANFEGTEVNAEGQASLDIGGDLNVTAAANTAQSSENSVEVEAGIEVGDGFDLSAEVGVSQANEQSSEAVAGAFNVGGLDIRTGGDANFEGTQIASEGDANLDIGGDLDFTAARSTETSSSLEVGVEAGLGDSSFNLGAEVGVADFNSNQAEIGSLTSGGVLNISTGGDATFEGTELGAEEGVVIDADGAIAFNEALSTETNTEVGVGLGFGSESEEEEDEESGETTRTDTSTVNASLALDLSDEAQGQGSRISGGNGGIVIRSGGDVTLQGTEFDQDAEIDADGNIIRRELTDESSGFAMDIEVEAEFESETTSGGNEDSDSEDDDRGDEETRDDGDSERSDEETRDERDNERGDELNESFDEPRRPGDDNDTQTDRVLAELDDGDREGDDLRNLFDEEASEADGSDDAKTDADKNESSEDKKEDDEEDEGGAPEIGMFDEEEEEEGQDDEGDNGESSGPQTLTLSGSSVEIPGLNSLDSIDEVELVDGDGNDLPEWIRLDLDSGELVVNAPDDLAEALQINLTLPSGESFTIDVE